MARAIALLMQLLNGENPLESCIGFTDLRSFLDELSHDPTAVPSLEVQSLCQKVDSPSEKVDTLDKIEKRLVKTVSHCQSALQWFTQGRPLIKGCPVRSQTIE
jgi:hypothetical protein